MIRNATEQDFDDIYVIINDAAICYKGIIPDDRWNEPYMTKEELNQQIREGVHFTCFVDEGRIVGVMGIQDQGEVNLIRHAYVKTVKRNSGIGSALLLELITLSTKPILIGTWSAAHWAIKFYQNHDFYLVSEDEKNRLLVKYWCIPLRQVETSVVLTDRPYKNKLTKGVNQSDPLIKNNGTFGDGLTLSGNSLAVGAYPESSNAASIGGDQGDNSASRAGAVYVFDRN